MHLCVPAVTGMPVQQQSMDSQGQCASLLRCGNNVRITVTALNNGERYRSMQAVAHVM